MVDKEMDAALVSRGYIGPSVPEGTVLFAYMRRAGKREPNHKVVFESVQLRLLRPNADDIEATQGIVLDVYPRSAAPPPPAGTVVGPEWTRGPGVAGSYYPMYRVQLRAAAAELASVLAAVKASEQTQ